jgi:hypothetical protein
MNRWSSLQRQRRLVAWAVGSVLALVYYYLSAVQLPHRTVIGVERPICGIGHLSAAVKESPSGRRWFLAVTLPDASTTAASASGTTASWVERLQEFQWPGGAETPRRLAPFRAQGTWLLNENRLNWVWDRSANGWQDDSHLWSRSDLGQVVELTIAALPGERLALRGRSDRIHDDEEPNDATGGFEQADWDPRDLWPALSSPLEELPRDIGWRYGHHVISGRGVYVVYTLARGGEPGTLYAVSDEPAPRILRLASQARPLALSRDGRTLFFARGGVLWRLDLRKPLPELLDEVSMPELPDPLAGPTSRDRRARARGLRGRR